MLPTKSIRLLVSASLLCASLGTLQAQSVTTAASAATAPPATGAPPPYRSGSETALGEKVTALLAQPAVSRAHWGIAVTALDGTPIYGLEEGKLFRPASTAKLFTTAAAMALLGPDKTWTTEVRGDLDAATGTVQGDLVLVGAGDANFGTDDVPYVAPAQRTKMPAKPPALRDLEQLADQLAAKGVKQVTGNVVGDDTLFVYEPYGEGWNQDDAVWGYGAPVSALSIADNQLTLTTTPGSESGARATATLQQYGVPYYTLAQQADTSPRGGRESVQVERSPGSRTLRVYGFLREGAAADVEHVAVDDPAAFAATALQQMLKVRGIDVQGTARAQHMLPYDAHDFLSSLRQPETCVEDLLQHRECRGAECLTSSYRASVLASHISPPLVADVTVTAKLSQNLHAEVLLHQLGRLAFCGKGTTLEGARIVRAFALHAGVNGEDFTLYDGSGLSTKDVVTPRAEAQLLAYAARQPWFAPWRTALPVGGVDGSLAVRFKEAPLKDHVFAKTGTLGESRALAGYLQCASGRTVIFSVMVDNHLPGTSSDRDAMDRIVAAIAETQ